MYLSHLQTNIASHSYHIHCLSEAVSSRPGTAQPQSGTCFENAINCLRTSPFPTSPSPERAGAFPPSPQSKDSDVIRSEHLLRRILAQSEGGARKRGIDEQGSRYDIQAKLARSDKGCGRWTQDKYYHCRFSHHKQRIFFWCWNAGAATSSLEGMQDSLSR